MELCQPDDAGGGAVLLHTAALAAVAGHSLVPVQHQMADLRAGAVSAVEQIALNDDAAANTGAQGDEYHVVAALAAALPEFAQSGHVGVIACLHGEAGEGRQGVRNIEHAPTQIDALVYNAFDVDGAGNADAEAQNVAVGNAVLGQIALDGRGDVRQDLAAAVGCNGGDFPLVQHFTGFVEISDLDGGAAQIDAKAVFHWVKPPVFY